MAKIPTHDQIMAMPLRQQMVAYEEARHRARMNELKKASATLALLEVEHKAIKAAGYHIYPESIHSTYQERSTLSVVGSAFDGDARLCKALLIAGFAISKRADTTHSLGTAHFKKGRLTIRVTLRHEDLARAECEAIAVLAPATEASQ